MKYFKLLSFFMIYSSYSLFGAEIFNAPVCEITVSGVTDVWVLENGEKPGMLDKITKERVEKHLNGSPASLIHSNFGFRFWRFDYNEEDFSLHSVLAAVQEDDYYHINIEDFFVWKEEGSKSLLAKKTYYQTLNYESKAFMEEPTLCGKMAQSVVDDNDYLEKDQVTWLVKIAESK